MPNVISNTKINTLVEGENSADSITNTGSNVTIDARNGNDTVNNQSDNVSINGGQGNDSIISTGSTVTLLGDNGADSIYSNGSKVLIDLGSNDDYASISSDSSNITIKAGAGDDTIENDGSKVTINGGLGDDSIGNWGSKVSINAGKGNDSIILANGTNVTVNVSDGNDTISVGNAVNSFTVQKFAAGDEIQFDGREISSLGSVKGGVTADDVTITGLKLSKATSLWSLKSGVANYYETFSSGVTLNEGKIVYRAAGESSLFTIGNVATTSGLSVDTNYEKVTVAAEALNKQTVTISGDYTLYIADDVKLTEIKDVWAKSGTNYAYNIDSTIAGYELNDNAINYIPATYGDTMVEVSGLKSAPALNGNIVTISANKFSGDVSIVSNAGKYNFELAKGDYSLKTFNGSANDDSIRNFGSSISIAGNSGNDYLYNEGNNTTKVTLSGGAGNDTLENNSASTTLDGGAGNDSINNIGSNVSINAGAGDDSIFNGDNDVKIIGGEGSDSISNIGDEVSISGGAGNNSIKNEGSNVTIGGGADNDTVENSGANVLFQYAGGNDVISGFNDTSTLQLTSGSITSAYSNGTDAFLTVGKSTITLKDLSTLTNVINVMDSVGNASSYTINLIRGTAAADDISNGNSSLKIQALGGDDTISNSGGVVSIDGGADNDIIENSGSSVSITGGAGSDTISNSGSKVTIDGDASNNFISNTGSNVSINGGEGADYIELNLGNSVTVNVNSGNDTISVADSISSFTVENFSSGDRIQLNSTVSALGSVEGAISAGNVTIAGLTTSETTPTWTFNNNAATYSEKYSAGAILSDDRKAVTYRTASTTSFFTVSGVTSAKGINLDNTTVTVSKAALGTRTVSITDGYTLALGDDVPEWYIESPSWYMNDTIATYKGDATVAGYELIDNKINYVKAVDGETLLELGGVSIEPSLSGNSVTLSAENFADNVSILSNAGEYDITLNGDDYNGKIFSGSNAGDSIFNSGGLNLTIDSGAGDDSINNHVGAENVVVNTGDGNDSIENWGYFASINSGSGNDFISNYTDDATINPGAGNDTLEVNGAKTFLQYSSGDGNDFITGYNGANISIDLLSGTFGGYSTVEETDLVLKIGSNALTFQNATDELISLGTSTGTDYLWNNINSIMIEAGANNNVIDNKGSYVTVNSGAGNDTVTLSADESGNTFAFTANSGKDVLYNFTSSDVIKIADNSRVKVSGNKKDVLLKVGRGSITLKDAAANTTSVTIVNSDDKTISAETYATAGIIKEAGLIELWQNISETSYTADDDISTVDGSNVTRKIKIIGAEGIPSELIGGKKNDTLEGSISNDTLTGGKGSDIFVYTGGNDIITDYSKQDKISIGGTSLAIEGYDIDDNDNLILNFNDGGTLTIEDGAGKAINFVENNKTTTRFYKPAGIFDKKKKYIELSGNETTFNAADYSKLVTLDASNVMDYMEITGNSKANVIIASGIASTLNGGRGKDTLIGSEDMLDVFVYENKGGKDVIEGYGVGDVISLGSGVTFKDSKFKKDNAVIKFKSGSITINDATDLEVTLNSADTENDTIYSGGVFIDYLVNSVAKVYGSYNSSIDLNKYEYSIMTADATEARKKISLIGSADDNTLLGGKGKDTLFGDAGNDSLVGGKGKDSLIGGDGEDSLWGGAGNDTLWGGDGDDTFIFHAGEGKDVIADYTEGDLLQILNKNNDKAATFTGAFADNTLTLSVKGGGKVIVTGEDFSSTTTVTINDESKTVSDWTT